MGYNNQSHVQWFSYLGLAAVIYGVQPLGKGLYLQRQKTVEHHQQLNNWHHAIMQRTHTKKHINHNKIDAKTKYSTNKLGTYIIILNQLYCHKAYYQIHPILDAHVNSG